MAAENFRVKKGLEVGTATTITSNGINVTGVITATQLKGDGSGLTNVVGSGSGVVLKDEGSAVGTAGTINFVGSGVAATLSAGIATVTISSGGLDNIIEDTTPQLGGNLDLDGKFITGSGGINVTGVVTATTLKGDGDFVDIDVDGHAELDDLNVSGITTSALLDVSSLTNGRVAYVGSASGRLVDSANLTFDGTSLFVSGINVVSGGTTSTFGADIVTRNFNATGVSTLTNAVSFGSSASFNDDKKVFFGSDEDFSIKHSGNNAFIDNDTGNLNIQSDTTVIGNKSGGSIFAQFTDGGAAKLYFAGNQKLTTTGSGIEVPDLSVTGVGTIGQIETDGVTLGTNATTFAAKFADDAVANFGTDNDLKISHDNAHARITNGTGDIVISGIISAINDVKVGSAITMNPTSGIISATKFVGDGSSLTNLPGGGSYGNSDVDNHLNTGTASNGEVLSWTGSDYDWVAQGGGGSIAGISTTGTSVFNQIVVGSGVTANSTGINATGIAVTAGRFHADGGSFQAQIGISNQGFYLYNGASTHLAISYSSSANINQFRGNSAGDKPLLIDDFSYITISPKSSSVTLQYAESTKLVTDTAGVKITGVCTASSFSGSLDASNLTGEIESGRFPATLPASSGENLTALNATEITSGTLPIARIDDGDVTFAKIQDVATNIIIGRNAVGSGDVGALSASDVRTLINVADGANVGVTTATWTVGNNYSSNYTFTGPGNLNGASNSTLYLARGVTYRFNVNASGHGFGIQTSSGAWNASNEYTTGITNPRADNGVITFAVPFDAPNNLYYACTSNHSNMVGTLVIYPSI